MSDPSLSRASLLTVLCALIADELRALRHLPSHELDPNSWPDDSLISAPRASDADDQPSHSLQADSLELMALATRVNTYFHMHESGIEDYLLRHRRLCDWAELVEKARGMGARDITFNTSGSTGKPKQCTQAWDTLVGEIQYFHTHFEQLLKQPITRIVALTPPHHIYGFLFSILMAEQANVPVIRGQTALAMVQRNDLQDGDLIVGFPSVWQHLSQQGIEYKANIIGLTSTGPCDPAVIHELKGQGLPHVVEIYGSSETSGIGWRTRPEDPFTLLPRWQKVSDTDDQLLDGHHQTQVTLSDRLDWVDDRHIRPTGRKDSAVQVAGVNVFPARIATQLTELPEVANAAVRLMRPEEGERLKAFVVPADPSADETALRQQLTAWCEQHLNTEERPRAFRFGPQLPVNSLNKPADWDASPPSDSGYYCNH